MTALETGMAISTDPFQKIASAEKELCAAIGPEIAALVRQIERKVGLPINAIQVVGTHEPSARWLNATCTVLS